MFSSVKTPENKQLERWIRELKRARTSQRESMALPKSEVSAELGLKSAIFSSQ